MNEFKKRLIHLHHCRGITWNIIFTILKKDPQLKRLYDFDINEYFSPKVIPNTILSDLHSPKLIKEIHHYNKYNVHAITLFDLEYPCLLRETYKPPWVLYAKGNTKLLTANKYLAVVGSRQMTAYGKKAIELLFPELIQKGFVIVSGLARGIDTHAHQTTMNLDGHTIGVIAGGFQHIYPKENEEIAKDMMKRQLVLSEYPPSAFPQKWQFPMRNRIISGICQGTLVIEAKKSSGSLITANYALHEGREVFAVPGHILNVNSVGTNELIQQGAKLVMKAKDILEELAYL